MPMQGRRGLNARAITIQAEAHNPGPVVVAVPEVVAAVAEEDSNIQLHLY